MDSCVNKAEKYNLSKPQHVQKGTISLAYLFDEILFHQVQEKSAILGEAYLINRNLRDINEPCTDKATARRVELARERQGFRHIPRMPQQ